MHIGWIGRPLAYNYCTKARGSQVTWGNKQPLAADTGGDSVMAHIASEVLVLKDSPLKGITTILQYTIRTRLLSGLHTY